MGKREQNQLLLYVRPKGNIIRMKLQEIKEDEYKAIDEFAERIEDLAANGHHGIPEYV